MNAYLCTYRHKKPLPREWRRTTETANNDGLLRSYLDCYESSYYDWGDDPSFFCAQHFMGDVKHASWGVCRADVRCGLKPDDMIVFFCGYEHKWGWSYYFTGPGTVREVISREALWADQAYKNYRSFYNVLARPDGDHLVQHEIIHDHHKDWKRRAKAPYVIFDPQASWFNLKRPHLVARWDRKTKGPEKWAADERSQELEQLLFRERGISRRLRTSTTGYGHSKLNLAREGGKVREGRSLQDLAKALAELMF